MRVTFVARWLDMSYGGANASLHLIAESLAERGHEVRVLTFQPSMNSLPSDPAYEIESPDERHVGTRVGVIYRVYQLMRAYEDDTDIFHLFVPVGLPGAGLYRLRGGSTPVVGRLNSYTMFCTNHDAMRGDCYEQCTTAAKFAHSDRSLGKRLLKTPLYLSRTVFEPRVVDHVDRFFAISPAVGEIYASVGLDADDVAVVPNFVDPEFASEPVDAARSHEGEELRALYAGRIKPSKGLATLVRAIDRASEPITLDVVGEGPGLADRREQVRSLGLGARVRFHGWVDQADLPRYYSEADVFVHPAQWPEPFGRTTLEALQCGTPAVVSDRGGPPWVVGDAGRTFPAGDAAALASELEALERDPGSLDRLAANCASELERFELSRTVSKIETEYESLLAAL